MIRALSFRLALCFLAVLGGALPLRAAGTMETYEIVWTLGMDQQKLRAYWDGATLRIDQPDDRFAVLYHEKDETFIGLELRDDFDWKFNWAALQVALQRQKDQTHDLQQNMLTGDNSVNLLGNIPAPSHEEPSTVVSWQPKAGSTGTWTGTGSLRGTVEASAGGTFPGLASFWTRYAKAADIIRTVAVREMAPSDLLPLVSALPEGARTITTLKWYRNGEMAETLQVTARSEPLDPSHFTIPPHFRETKLSTLDGVLEEAPAPEKHPSED